MLCQWQYGIMVVKFSDDKAMLKKVNDTLLAAKPKWKSMDYGNLAKFAAEDIYAGVNWNGASMRGKISK